MQFFDLQWKKWTKETVNFTDNTFLNTELIDLLNRKIEKSNTISIEDQLVAILQNKEYELTWLKLWLREIESIEKIDENIALITEAIFFEKLLLTKSKKDSYEHENRIIVMEELIDDLEREKKWKINSFEVASALRLKTLLTYKEELNNQWYIRTPTRIALKNRAINEFLAGRNVMLSGPTWTWKTELAKAVIRKINLLLWKYYKDNWVEIPNLEIDEVSWKWLNSEYKQDPQKFVSPIRVYGKIMT